MTREQIDECIAMCDNLLATTLEHDPIPYKELAKIGLLTPYAQYGVSTTNLHTAVEQRRREFVFMRELRDKWFL
jgi:hypothetical protein